MGKKRAKQETVESADESGATIRKRPFDESELRQMMTMISEQLKELTGIADTMRDHKIATIDVDGDKALGIVEHRLRKFVSSAATGLKDERAAMARKKASGERD